MLSWLVVALAASCAYTIYLWLSRGPLSPLRGTPGPRLAAFTSWYECYYDVVKPAQYVFKIRELHRQYGPVVRIGPNDISISDPDFVDTIYAPGIGHKRDKDHAKNKALRVDNSVGGSIAHTLHRRRREALNPFFSLQRIGRLDDELDLKSEQLNAIFEQVKQTREVLNLSDAYFAFANDVVHRCSFGEDPNLLADLPLAAVRRDNVAAVLRSVKVMLHFGWLRTIIEALPASLSDPLMPLGVRDMLKFRAQIRQRIDAILARHEPSDNEAPSIFTHLRDSTAIPPTEKSAQRLEDEATLIVMAGTYSPMLSLIIAHYHLFANPELMQQLRAELIANPDTTKSAARLAQLPYVAGVIQEAHRLSFGLAGRNSRICPDETVRYEHSKGTLFFPPGTSLSAPTLLIHTNESMFPDPWRFDPGRWMPSTANTPETLTQRRRSMIAFMRGPRACIGMHLANAEMAAALAVAAQWDMRLYGTSECDVAFCHDYHVLSPQLTSKGVRVQVLGRADPMR